LSAIWTAPAWQIIAGLLIFFWSITTELWFLIAMWHVVANRRKPYPVGIALGQPRLPALLRPIAALW
jgi:hypothetical protein